MTFKKALSDIVTGKKPIIDIIHYLVGNYRYWLYYSMEVEVEVIHKLHTIIGKRKKNVLMRRHIYEQIEYRIKCMRDECYNGGECIKCGCNTTQLQMCDKSCKGLCYPTMMDKGQWEYYKAGGVFKDVHGTWTPEISNNNRPILL